MNKIQEFNDLHHSEEILFLGNAWDLLSALSLEKAGFKAIGTTSWGIANTLGYSDGEKIDFDIHLGIIKTIVDHVKIPVSADIESGYGEDTKTIIDHVLKTADLGVSGINIEDSLKKQIGLRELDQHCDLLSKIRTALENNGYKDFYINARTAIAAQVAAPLNVLSLPGLTNCNKLKELGVKRFSFGNALSDKIAAFLENSAAQIYASKDTSFLYDQN